MKILRQANEFKKQTSAAGKQYQSFEKAFNHDQKEELVKNKKEGHESSLFYNKKMILLNSEMLENIWIIL